MQIEYFPIENPCRQICRFNRQHICRTCHRKREEKKAWDSYTEQEKRSVLRKCHRRKIAYLRAERQLIFQQQKPKPTEQLPLFKLISLDTHSLPKSNHVETDNDNPQLSLFDE